jgi:hypothetical protein
VRVMAEIEGLTAHAFSVDVRLTATKQPTQSVVRRSGFPG